MHASKVTLTHYDELALCGLYVDTESDAGVTV